MKMVQDYKDFTHTTEVRLAYDEWMEQLEYRVDGQFTALTDDDDDVHVDMGDSAQLLYNGLKKKATTAHTFTEVTRGVTRTGDTVENDQDHRRGPKTNWGPKLGLPMTFPDYARRMISETVGGEKIGECLEQFLVLLEKVKEQMAEDKANGKAPAGKPSLREFHSQLLAASRDSKTPALVCLRARLHDVHVKRRPLG